MISHGFRLDLVYHLFPEKSILSEAYAVIGEPSLFHLAMELSIPRIARFILHRRQVVRLHSWPQMEISLTIKKIHGLEEHPLIGAPFASIIDIQSDCRFLVCDNYLIFYRCEDKKIFVLRILYDRRDYIRILCGGFLADE